MSNVADTGLLLKETDNQQFTTVIITIKCNKVWFWLYRPLPQISQLAQLFDQTVQVKDPYIVYFIFCDADEHLGFKMETKNENTKSVTSKL